MTLTELQGSPVIQYPASDYPFLLVSSSGPAADLLGDMFGLYRKTEKIREGRSVYTQMNDTKYSYSPHNLLSHQGVWTITNGSTGFLRASTTSGSPTSDTLKYKEHDKNTWHDDPALTVTSLSEKPDVCEVTISLSEDIKGDIDEPGMEGMYKADGSYYNGRPVLQHQGGRFTLHVGGLGYWEVSTGVGGAWFLESGSAPSQCPADPRAARNEMKGQTRWRYRNKQYGWRTESSGISVKCKTHLIEEI